MRSTNPIIIIIIIVIMHIRDSNVISNK